MSAVFEVNMIYRGYKEFFELLNLLKKNELYYSVDSIEIMDDWEYNNHQIIEINEIQDYKNLLEQDKIIMINGLYKKQHNFGVAFLSLEQDIFEINFWISTSEFQMLDNSYITNDNLEIYNAITRKLIKLLNPNSLIFCALGSEIFLENNANIEKMLNSSVNVCEWIFSNEIESSFLKRYDRKVVNDFIIYSLYEK